MSETAPAVEKPSKERKVKEVTKGISAPNFKTVVCDIVGTAPYVSNKFSVEAKEMMREKQAAGSQKANLVGKPKREPKNFEALSEESTHKTKDGKYGIPCVSFRAALISACRLVNFKMTLAKLGLFVVSDVVDDDEGKPLVEITGAHHHCEHYTRNQTGVADIRAREMWDAGWKAKVTMQYDADIFSETDVRNLLMRVGCQVGVGAGRPDSTESVGQGWGTFKLA